MGSVFHTNRYGLNDLNQFRETTVLASLALIM